MAPGIDGGMSYISKNAYFDAKLFLTLGVWVHYQKDSKGLRVYNLQYQYPFPKIAKVHFLYEDKNNLHLVSILVLISY